MVFLENSTPVQETGQGKVPTVGIPLPFLFLRNAREIYESLIIVSEVRLLFGDLVVSCLGGPRWLQEVSSWVQGGIRRSREAQSSRTVA